MLSQVRRLFLSKTVKAPIANFGSWKDREETAQNLFINQTEKNLIKKLLKKMENEGDDAASLDKKSSLVQFDRQLKMILSRYRIENPGLQAELSRLHKEHTNNAE